MNTSDRHTIVFNPDSNSGSRYMDIAIRLEQQREIGPHLQYIQDHGWPKSIQIQVALLKGLLSNLRCPNTTSASETWELGRAQFSTRAIHVVRALIHGQDVRKEYNESTRNITGVLIMTNLSALSAWWKQILDYQDSVSRNLFVLNVYTLLDMSVSVLSEAIPASPIIAECVANCVSRVWTPEDMQWVADRMEEIRHSDSPRLNTEPPSVIIDLLRSYQRYNKKFFDNIPHVPHYSRNLVTALEALTAYLKRAPVKLNGSRVTEQRILSLHDLCIQLEDAHPGQLQSCGYPQQLVAFSVVCHQALGSHSIIHPLHGILSGIALRGDHRSLVPFLESGVTRYAAREWQADPDGKEKQTESLLEFLSRYMGHRAITEAEEMSIGDWPPRLLKKFRPYIELLDLHGDAFQYTHPMAGHCCSVSHVPPSPNGDANGDAKFRVCSACRVVQYCSFFCQKEDWLYHKDECGKFGRDKEAVEKRHVQLKPHHMGHLIALCQRFLHRHSDIIRTLYMFRETRGLIPVVAFGFEYAHVRWSPAGHWQAVNSGFKLPHQAVGWSESRFYRIIDQAGFKAETSVVTFRISRDNSIIFLFFIARFAPLTERGGSYPPPVLQSCAMVVHGSIVDGVDTWLGEELEASD